MSTEAFDPYHRWLGIPPKHQPPDHYRLLGIERFESDAEVICDAADRQMMHVRTYQLGEYSSLSQKILNELAVARVCLLNPEKKAAYDEQLRARLASTAPSPPARVSCRTAVIVAPRSATPSPQKTGSVVPNFAENVGCVRRYCVARGYVEDALRDSH